MSVFLSGFMAAGKSTVGRELAQILEYPFADLDAAVVTRAGLSVLAVFEQMGEAHFRALESEELERLAGGPSIVVALGGGTVVSETNRDRCRSAGSLVWLDTERSTILHRLSDGGSERPLYRNRAEAERMYGERLNAYRDCDLRLRPRPGESPRRVAERIASRLD